VGGDREAAVLEESEGGLPVGRGRRRLGYGV
jgi:hypothetical protein